MGHIGGMYNNARKIPEPGVMQIDDTKSTVTNGRIRCQFALVNNFYPRGISNRSVSVCPMLHGNERLVVDVDAFFDLSHTVFMEICVYTSKISVDLLFSETLSQTLNLENFVERPIAL